MYKTTDTVTRIAGVTMWLQAIQYITQCTIH
jgi:hypothetical protein